MVWYYMPPETSGNPSPGDHPKCEVTCYVRESSIGAHGSLVLKSRAMAHYIDDEVHGTRVDETGALCECTACTGDNKGVFHVSDNPR